MLAILRILMMIDWPMSLRDALECFLIDCPFDAQVYFFPFSPTPGVHLSEVLLLSHCDAARSWPVMSAPVMDFHYFPCANSFDVYVAYRDSDWLMDVGRPAHDLG